MTLATEHPTSPAATFTRRRYGTPSEPVVVALKPYEGCDAALAVAQWLAGDEGGSVASPDAGRTSADRRSGSHRACRSGGGSGVCRLGGGQPPPGGR